MRAAVCMYYILECIYGVGLCNLDECNIHASSIAICGIEIKDSCNSNSCPAITRCVLGHVHGHLWSCMYVYHKM